MKTVLSRLTQCDAASPAAVCLKDGRCFKHFPKEYDDRTEWWDERPSPVYRRAGVLRTSAASRWSCTISVGHAVLTAALTALLLPR